LQTTVIRGKTLSMSAPRPLAGSIFGVHDWPRACQTNAPSTTRIPVNAENASTLVSSGPSTAGPSKPPTRVVASTMTFRFPASRTERVPCSPTSHYRGRTERPPMPPALPAKSRPHLRSCSASIALRIVAWRSTLRSSSVGPVSKALSRSNILRRCASITALLAVCYFLATHLLHYTAKGFWCKALYLPEFGEGTFSEVHMQNRA
jgi:hypothetical protein